LPDCAAAGEADAAKRARPVISTQTQRIDANTLQAGGPADWLRARPLTVVAATLVAVEAALAAAGGSFPLLSLLVLSLAPGLALVPLLPAGTLERPAAALCAAPVLGFAAASVLLVSASSVGILLTGAWTRVLLGALVVAAAAVLPAYDPRAHRAGLRRAELVAVAAALVAGAAVGLRVIGELPVPGNDWAKYALYADEIRRQHALLIDNPFWLLGVPFREEPGTPALYGSFLALTGLPAGVVAQGIGLFALGQVLAVFAFVRTFWSATAAGLAAVLYAVLPVNFTLLGWHGLANAAALALLPLVLLYSTEALRRRLAWREAVGFALLLVALAACHRLSSIVGAAAVVLSLGAGLVFLSDRRRDIAATGLRTAAALAFLAPAVAYDLITRGRTFGGTLGYEAYADTKLDLELLARDLSIPFTALALGGLALAIGRVRRDPVLLPLLVTLAVIAGFTWSWVVHLPLVYLRMAYYFPLVLVPLAVVALIAIPRARVALVAGLAVAAFAFYVAEDEAPRIRTFYGFANQTSLRGLDAVSARLRPDEVVVTDRCWSFLGTWLLHTRTLAALETIDIQPKAELTRAREAKAIIAGSDRGRALARQLGVRFLLVDPTCPTAEGTPARAPGWGRPVFVSERLAVLTLR
jgi:hypothetical protein